MPSDQFADMQYRVCGQHSVRGQWEGTWRSGEPSKTDRYDFEDLKKRNDRVWLERRHVVTTILPQEEL